MKLSDIANQLHFNTYFAKDVKDKNRLIRQKVHVDVDDYTTSELLDWVYSMQSGPNDAFVVTTASRGKSYIGIVVLAFDVKELPITKGTGNVFVKERFQGRGIASAMLQRAERKVLEVIGDDVTISGDPTFNAVARRSFKVLKVK